MMRLYSITWKSGSPVYWRGWTIQPRQLHQQDCIIRKNTTVNGVSRHETIFHEHNNSRQALVLNESLKSYICHVHIKCWILRDRFLNGHGFGLIRCAAEDMVVDTITKGLQRTPFEMFSDLFSALFTGSDTKCDLK